MGSKFTEKFVAGILTCFYVRDGLFIMNLFIVQSLLA